MPDARTAQDSNQGDEVAERVAAVVNRRLRAAILYELQTRGGVGIDQVADEEDRASLKDIQALVTELRRHGASAGTSDRAGRDVRSLPGDRRRRAGRRRDVPGDGLAGLGPFDIAVVANVCHLFDEPKNLRMLQRIAGTLAPRGVLAIVDQVLDDDPDWARWSALYGLGVLHCAPAAHLFTARTYLDRMRACGLRDATARPLSALPPLTLVSARR